jgi:AP2 domain/HNH endonuclease
MDLLNSECNQVDHVDGNGLNNIRSNLRAVTASQNQHNRNKNKLNTSGFKGVGWHKKTGKWRCQIMNKKTLHHIGTYSTIEEASAAYFDASKKLHGQFGKP